MPSSPPAAPGAAGPAPRHGCTRCTTPADDAAAHRRGTLRAALALAVAVLPLAAGAACSGTPAAGGPAGSGPAGNGPAGNGPAAGGPAAAGVRGAPAAVPVHPAGRISLRVDDPGGRPMSVADFRRRQAGGSAAVRADGADADGADADGADADGADADGADADDGADDALLDGRTLRVIRRRPLRGSGSRLVLDRPAGAVTLSFAWPSTAGYSTVLLDLPAPGDYLLNDLLARQAVADLDLALAARAEHTPGPALAALVARARAGHGDPAYDAAVRAQLALLTEYGTAHAADRRTARRAVCGVTVDDPDADTALRAARGLVPEGGPAAGRDPVAVRLVFDAGERPERYRAVVDRAHALGLVVVGQLLDSSDMASFPVARWEDRVRRYVAALPAVDVWEVGNEVNGGWLGPGVPEKVAYAAAWVKAHSRARTMLTLYWQLGEDDADRSVFTWAARHLPPSTVALVDEIGLSVYPGGAPLGVAFDRVVRTLHAAFPAQTLAVTELGYGSADLDSRWWWGHPTDRTGAGRRAVADFYGRAVLGYPFSGGGTYWWYFRTEAPQGSPLWRTLAQIGAATRRSR